MTDHTSNNAASAMDESVEVKPEIPATSVLSSTTLTASEAGSIAASSAATDTARSSNTTGSSPLRRSNKEPHKRRRSHFEALIEKTRSGYIDVQPSIEEDEDGSKELAQESEAVSSKAGFQSVPLTDSDEQEQSTALQGPPPPMPSPPGRVRRTESGFKDIGDGYTKFAANVGMDRHVQVHMRSFYYHVPVKMDAPSIKTVLNQSVVYVIFEFFRRVHWYCQRKQGNTTASNNNGSQQSQGRWGAETPSDLFLPFDKKAILDDVTLCFEPGKTYLVLAPPGGGKTTLLKAIAGLLPYATDLQGKAMKNKPHIDGRIEFNGVTKEEEPEMILPNIVSFVGQLDNHAPYLTVKETFDFAFQCRTGGTHSNLGVKSDNAVADLDKENFTENLTIEGLDLAHVADTFVGNDDVRGVSGGQRRRVTVGEMMQGQNPVACADEISTGLDAAVTHDIVHSIVAFSKKAMTTRIISLLQPGPETVSLFDEIVLLAEGKVIFAGKIEEVVEYFANLGYKQPATMDVADFIQSIPTADGALYFDAESSPRSQHYTTHEFHKAFVESKQFHRILDKIDSHTTNRWSPLHNSKRGANGDEEQGHSSKKEVPEQYRTLFQNSFIRSMSLNFKRHLTLWTRDIGFIIGKMFENIGMAVATGGILFGQAKLRFIDDIENLDPVETADAQYKLVAGIYGALFMTTFHILLGTMTSAPDEVDGRSIHYKHHDSNFYQTYAFVFGRLVSTFPQRTIEIVSFGIPLYWMVGLAPTAEGFFIYLAILICYTIGLKLMFSILAQTLPKKANVQGVGTFLVLLMVLFGGFIVYPSAMPRFYTWIAYANPMAWALQGLVSNEFTSDKYDAIPGGGEQFLRVRGFQTGREWVYYTFAFMVPFTILSGFVLGTVMNHVRIEPEVNDVKGNKISIGTAEDDNDEEDFNLPFTPVDLTFEKLVYEVKASTGNETLKLLNEVSGIFAAGRMVALMGSSGAGKTTLMDVIAMRKDSGTITGDIFLNGFPQERSSFLRVSGYVEQFDIQQPELTVRETVEFCAQLRLDANDPGIKDNAGKLKFASHVLRTMELTNIQNLQVGSYEEGGLTFEQRKRLAIACELAGSPSVIFLDEPTSGLDSRGALVVMRAMKRIADTGRTVCSTVHQPSGAVFQMFDDLLLLTKGGNTVFFGELGPDSVNLIDYFENRGAEPIEFGENPAAWMLRAQTSGAAAEVNWPEAYKSSEQYTALFEKLEAVKASPDESKKLGFEQDFPTSAKERVTMMNQRIMKIYKRSPAYNLARLMISIFYAFIIGSVFLRGDGRRDYWAENEVDAVLSTMFFSLIVIGVTVITMAVPVTKTLRDVFYKHRASGMLTHKSLSTALFIGEIPYICLISVLFGAIYYGTVGLFSSAKKFWYFFLFFTLNVANYAYFGQAFICLVKDIPTAGALMGALIGYNVFFSGLIVKPQYFSGPFQLGYWTAPGRFAFEGLATSQFNGIETPVLPEYESPFFFSRNCSLAVNPPVISSCNGTMDEYVDFYFGGRFTNDNFWLDVGCLLGYLLLSRILSFFALAKFNYSNS